MACHRRWLVLAFVVIADPYGSEAPTRSQAESQFDTHSLSSQRMVSVPPVDSGNYSYVMSVVDDGKGGRRFQCNFMVD
jgi:hypothetical protein